MNTTDENGKFESVHSNLMSITLESPTNSLKKNMTANTSSISNNLSHSLLTNVSPNVSNNVSNCAQSQPVALPRIVIPGKFEVVFLLTEYVKFSV